jgi:Na+/melibiose symporter-like transporter
MGTSKRRMGRGKSSGPSPRVPEAGQVPQSARSAQPEGGTPRGGHPAAAEARPDSPAPGREDLYEDAVTVPPVWSPTSPHSDFAAGLEALKDDPSKLSLPEAPPEQADNVPLWQLFVLALPQLSMTSLTLLLNVHLLSFYSKLGAPIALVTLFITIARSADVLTDPAVSWCTDNGKLSLCWRKGVRRKPFMFLGPLIYDVAIVFLLGTPIEFGANGTAWAVWYGVWQTVLYIGDTVCSIPLSAILPAMSTNSATREKVFMCSRAVNSFGILIAALAPVPLGWLLQPSTCIATECAACSGLASASAIHECMEACKSVCALQGSRLAFRWLGVFFAVWHLFTLWAVVFLIPEPGLERDLFRARLKSKKRQGHNMCCCCTCCERCAWRSVPPGDPEVSFKADFSEPIVAAVQKTLRNSAFIALIPAAVLDMVAFTLIGTTMALFVDYVIKPLDVPDCQDDGVRTIVGITSAQFCASNDVWLALALLALMLAQIIFIPVWRCLSSMFGTRNTWLTFNLFGALTTGLFVFAGEGAPVPSVILSFLNGIPQAAMFLNDSLLSQTIDYDAVLQWGERAEARFSMFSSLTPKLASVPAQAIPLSILAAIGFREPVNGVQQDQPQHVKYYISSMFFVFPTIITLISWVLKFKFPIRHQEQLDRVSLFDCVYQVLTSHECRLPTTTGSSRVRSRGRGTRRFCCEIPWTLPSLEAARDTLHCAVAAASPRPLSRSLPSE